MATVNGIKLKVGDRVRLKPFGLAKLTQSAELQKPSIAEEMEKYFGGTYVVDSVIEYTLGGYPLISLDGVSYWVFHHEWIEEIIPEIDCDDCMHQPTMQLEDTSTRHCVDCVATGCKSLFKQRVDTKQQSAGQGGVKYDAGKKRYDLVPVEFEEAVADVLTFGSEKYGDRNWEKGLNPQRLYAAARRHMAAWQSGEKNDIESGKPHLAHAATCLAMLLTFESRGITTSE